VSGTLVIVTLVGHSSVATAEGAGTWSDSYHGDRRTAMEKNLACSRKSLVTGTGFSKNLEEQFDAEFSLIFPLKKKEHINRQNQTTTKKTNLYFCRVVYLKLGYMRLKSSLVKIYTTS